MEITGLIARWKRRVDVFSRFSLTVIFSVEVAVRWFGWTLEESRSTFGVESEIQISENKEEFFNDAEFV